MTSPVDTSVKFMTSDMVGAIQGIAGAAGSLNNVLKAFLVNGWDTVTPTSIAVSGGVATITFPGGHSSVQEAVVLLSGVTGGPTGFADLNGEQKITSRVGNTATFAAPTVANGAATGTLSVKMAPCGWAEAFTGTNVSAFRAATGNRMFLRTIDTNTQDMRVIGYENMTAVGAGTGLFPTAVQVSGGYYWRKSEEVSALLNPYMIFGDGQRFFFGVATNFALNNLTDGMYLQGFGDFKTWKPSSDPYAAFLAGAPALGWPAQHLGHLSMNGSSSAMVVPRLHTNSGTSQFLDMNTETYDGAVISGNGQRGPYPGLTDSLFLSKPLVSVLLPTYGPRGEIPGIWHMPQVLPPGSFVKGDIIVGAGETAGRKLMVVPTTGSPSAANGQFATLIDVTGPWA